MAISVKHSAKPELFALSGTVWPFPDLLCLLCAHKPDTMQQRNCTDHSDFTSTVYTDMLGIDYWAELDANEI